MVRPYRGIRWIVAAVFSNWAVRLLTLARVSDRFVVTGGSRLSGEVAVGGAKNSVLKLMAAALLAEGTSTITNCPDILDVPLMAEVLRGLGATVELDGSTGPHHLAGRTQVRRRLRRGPTVPGLGVRARTAGGAVQAGQGRVARW